MSVTELERQNTGGRGFIDSESNDLHTIHGIAIGAGDITLGHKSGRRKLWTEEILRESAHTLEGKHIVANHENKDIYSVVGRITDSLYSDERQGVVFQGVVDDELIAKRIERGWLDVSPRIIHTKGEAGEMGIEVPGEIKYFDNLAIVTTGASPSNEVQYGEAEELSIEELQDCFENAPDDEEIEYQNLSLPDNVDLKPYLYDNPEGAEGASYEFGCEGYHEHDIKGEKWFMPCNDHDSFLKKLINRETGSELSENGEELEKMDYDEMDYSKEEMRIASQMSSYSEMTKTECLSLMDAINPERETDMDFMEKFMEKVSTEEYGKDKKYKNKNMESGSRLDGSILNKFLN